MKPSEHLQAAKQLLIEKGWIKGDFRNEAGAMCAEGACMEINSRHLDGWRQSMHYLSNVVPGGSVGAFNDNPTTSFEDILIVFDLAIRQAEKDEAANEHR